MKFLAALVLPCLASASALDGLPDGRLTSTPARPDTGNNTGVVVPSCNCTGAVPGADTNASAVYLCGDARLGPQQLPTKLPLGSFVASYNRLGADITVEQFLKAWTGPDGKYKLPPHNGFKMDVDGNAINGTLQLEVGTLIDRFGSEDGEQETRY